MLLEKTHGSLFPLVFELLFFLHIFDLMYITEPKMHPNQTPVPRTRMLLSGQNGPCSLTLLQIDLVGQTKIHPCLHIVYLQRCVILGTNMLIMYVGSKPDTADLTLQKGPLTSPPHPPTHRYCKYS